MPIQACRPGMRLAKKIFNEEGLVLLGEAVQLSEAYIDRLSKMGISYVYIEDNRTEGIEAPSLLSEETRREAAVVIRRQFKQMMNDSTSRKQPRQSSSIGKAFGGILDSIIDELSGHEDAMIMLNDMQATDHYLFQHSLNVCIYTTLLGIHHGYEKEEQRVLSMGALLHDIGKTQIDLNILNKPGKLTDEEFAQMKRHAELGYLILKEEPNIPLLSAHCAFQHHERLNGSGYPRGIRSDEIHEYAKWVAIADSYDAMTSHRVYKEATLPHVALELLYTGADTLYDASMLAVFRDRLAVYPIGMSVRLSTGETGVVARIHSEYPQRPIVRILTGPEGEALAVPHEIDLAQSLNVTIVSSHVEN
ncbi:HD-GYP domain-containing protein [Paenibacillus dendritiformis]|uniref:HD-GYP domain-containing protein n=1 Tax=Paenibacillus dendritiformis TaxID=130049 RepID=UPI000DA8C0D1|nr:HD-GYP domain-containing protein [Paenibacillus dendritiformis]PZM65621.1 hypothetical protein DOE73_10800 [Paenibacillus dendritiformis]